MDWDGERVMEGKEGVGCVTNFLGGENAGLDAACRGDSLGQHRTGNLTWECFHGIFIVQ
jgi:hypothetical protein